MIDIIGNVLYHKYRHTRTIYQIENDQIPELGIFLSDLKSVKFDSVYRKYGKTVNISLLNELYDFLNTIQDIEPTKGVYFYKIDDTFSIRLDAITIANKQRFDLGLIAVILKNDKIVEKIQVNPFRKAEMLLFKDYVVYNIEKTEYYAYVKCAINLVYNFYDKFSKLYRSFIKGIHESIVFMLIQDKEPMFLETLNFQKTESSRNQRISYLETIDKLLNVSEKEKQVENVDPKVKYKNKFRPRTVVALDNLFFFSNMGKDNLSETEFKKLKKALKRQKEINEATLLEYGEKAKDLFDPSVFASKRDINAFVSGNTFSEKRFVTKDNVKVLVTEKKPDDFIVLDF